MVINNFRTVIAAGQFRGDGRTVRTLVFGVYKTSMCVYSLTRVDLDSHIKTECRVTN